VTAHIERLQHGHYVSVDSQFQVSHSEKPPEKPENGGWQLPQFLRIRQETTVDNGTDTKGKGEGDELGNFASFIAISFVFHPSNSLSHRFKSARIKITVDGKAKNTENFPKIIKYAPHLIYGAISPKDLKWTFNLTGSAGISQGPANATISPSTSYEEKATVHKMMKIQGSTRTSRRTGVEDGMLVWSLEENPLQKSGLPREFTFVLLVQRPCNRSDTRLYIEIEPVIASWFGHYPQLWLKKSRFQPIQKALLDFSVRIGQAFFSTISDPKSDTNPQRYNFATMKDDFEAMVELPGTTYSIKEPMAPGAETQSKPQNGKGD